MRANSSGQSPLLLLDVVDILNELHISYTVIGALAASFYGAIRASIDADAIISLGRTQRKKIELLKRLKKAGFITTCATGDRCDPIVGVINVEDIYNNRVDLLTGIRRMPEDIFLRTTYSTFLGSQIRIVGLEDFIAMKIFAGGQKDIEDVKNVLKVSGKKINIPLLKKLTSNYGKNKLKRLKVLLAEYHKNPS